MTLDDARRTPHARTLAQLLATASRRGLSPDDSQSMHAEAIGNRIRIHVTDTGIGIAPEKQEAIFQPFVQAEGGASRRAQGTGLGLTISRRIAEAMGGTLTVKSELRLGSTFTLELASATEKVPHAGDENSETSVTESPQALHRSHAIA